MDGNTKITFRLDPKHDSIFRQLDDEPRTQWSERIAWEILRLRRGGKTPTVDEVAEEIIRNPDPWMPKEFDKGPICSVTIRAVKALQRSNAPEAVRKMILAVG